MRVEGLELRAKVSGFRVQGSGSRVHGFRVEGLDFRVEDSGVRG